MVYRFALAFIAQSKYKKIFLKIKVDAINLKITYISETCKQNKLLNGNSSNESTKKKNQIKMFSHPRTPTNESSRKELVVAGELKQTINLKRIIITITTIIIKTTTIIITTTTIITITTILLITITINLKK